MAKRNSRDDKFTWGEGDLTFLDEVWVPENLRSIIDGMPKDDEKAFAYLQGKVRDKTINLDEFRFILNITAE
jgi:hypothetical protein